MIGLPSGAGYDRTIIMFDPKGRIFQVEYAMKAVRRGKPCIGVRYTNGVVIAIQRITDPLQDEDSLRKTFLLDDHILAAFAGITADARVLLEEGRINAQNYMLTYDMPISVESATRQISDVMQTYTQNGGVRPFGVALLIGGVDERGPHLFMTYPSGSYWEFKSAAIGQGMNEAMKYLQKRYIELAGGEENNRFIESASDAIVLSLEALLHVNQWEKIDAKEIEVGYIDIKDRKVHFLTEKENEEYLKKAMLAKEKEAKAPPAPETDRSEPSA
ncbi:MAG: archaeal proteasome endopeptidase complex subunit alpha [Candidatus Korarchaeota archaeon]